MTTPMTDITQQRQSDHTAPPLPGGVSAAPLVAMVRVGEPTPTSIQPPAVETTEPSKTTELHWKFAEETHQYVREHIRQADQKAAFFFAGATALIAFLYKATLIQRWIKLPTLWDFVDMLSFCAMIGLSVSALSCLATVFPRLKGSKRGHVFFGAVAEFESRKEYATDVLRQGVLALIDAKLCHVHDLALICGRKYAVLKIGQWSGAIGVVAMVALLLLAP